MQLFTLLTILFTYATYNINTYTTCITYNTIRLLTLLTILTLTLLTIFYNIIKNYLPDLQFLHSEKQTYVQYNKRKKKLTPVSNWLTPVNN